MARKTKEAEPGKMPSLTCFTNPFQETVFKAKLSEKLAAAFSGLPSCDRCPQRRTKSNQLREVASPEADTQEQQQQQQQQQQQDAFTSQLEQQQQQQQQTKAPGGKGTTAEKQEKQQGDRSASAPPAVGERVAAATKQQGMQLLLLKAAAAAQAVRLSVAAATTAASAGHRERPESSRTNLNSGSRHNSERLIKEKSRERQQQQQQQPQHQLTLSATQRKGPRQRPGHPRRRQDAAQAVMPRQERLYLTPSAAAAAAAADAGLLLLPGPPYRWGSPWQETLRGGKPRGRRPEIARLPAASWQQEDGGVERNEAATASCSSNNNNNSSSSSSNGGGAAAQEPTEGSKQPLAVARNDLRMWGGPHKRDKETSKLRGLKKSGSRASGCPAADCDPAAMVVKRQ
ncbi:hypothetical protein ACSSS7_002416 [Eimeria intestinalis]